MTRSPVYPGAVSLGLTIVDLVLRAIVLAWIVDLSMVLSGSPRTAALTAWIVAGAVHLGISHVWLIAPQARELVSADLTSLSWHALLAAVVVTISAFVIPVPSGR